MKKSVLKSLIKEVIREAITDSSTVVRALKPEVLKIVKNSGITTEAEVNALIVKAYRMGVEKRTNIGRQADFPSIFPHHD